MTLHEAPHHRQPIQQPEAMSDELLRLTYEARFNTAVIGLPRLEEPMVHGVIDRLAKQLHDNWVKQYIATHRTGDGQDDFMPRWKPVGNDTAWLAAAQKNPAFAGTVRFNARQDRHEVDIARVPFERLPNNPWAVENRVAAMQAVSVLHYALVTGTERRQTLLERVSADVHAMWVRRHPYVNERSDVPEEEVVRAVQRLDYDDERFTEAERNKDREHIVLAAELYAQAVHMSARRFERPHLGNLVRAATAAGSALLQRLIKRPDAPARTDAAEAVPLSAAEIAESAATMSTSFAALVNEDWQPTDTYITREGDMVRTFMWPANYASRPEHDHHLPMYTVGLRYTGDQYQQLGGAELTHFYNPYDSTVRADMTSSRRATEPAVTYSFDHYHSLSATEDVQRNTSAALKYGQVILSCAERDTRAVAA
jgi:hypothetical protein